MYINKAKKIVLKIGSSNLVDKQGKLKEKWLKSLVTDIEKLRRKGKEFVIVSSGAIALGQNHLKVKKKRLKIEMSQALASVGQIHLIDISEKDIIGNYLKIRNELSKYDKSILKKKEIVIFNKSDLVNMDCLLYTSPSPRDLSTSRMPSSA